MKKLNKYIIAIHFVFILSGLVFFMSSFDTPQEDIIGTWINDENTNSRWVFTSDNQCYQYYTGEKTEIYKYSISETSPQCGYQVKTGGVEDYYLRIYNTSGEEYCYEILGLTIDKLSLNYLGTTSKLLFNKQ